jgi:hypothetical protein
VEVIAKMQVINPFDFFVEDYAENIRLQYEPTLEKELGPYLEPREAGLLLMDFMENLKIQPDIKTVDFLVYLNQELYNALFITISGWK